MVEHERHEYQIILMNGRHLSLTRHELNNFRLSANTLSLSLIVLAIIAVMDPMLFPTTPLASSRLFYWGLCTIIYLACVPVWLHFMSGLWGRITTQPIPHIVVTIPLATILTTFSLYLHGIFGDPVPMPGMEMLKVYVKHTIILIIAESVALFWLLPLFRLRNSGTIDGTTTLPNATAATPEQPAPSDNPMCNDEDLPAFVILNGQSVRICEVLTARSSEHYLIIATENGTTEYRARMKDFVEQTPDSYGIQTHRSYWVSKTAATSFTGSAIVTQDGERIPVARSRVNDVRSWMENQLEAS